MIILVGVLFLLTIGLAVYALLPQAKDKKPVPTADIPKETNIIRPWMEPACPPVEKIEAAAQQKNNLETELGQIKQENADLKVELLSKAQPLASEEQSRKADGLIKENSDLANKIKLLETQIENYKKEIAKLNEAAAQKPQPVPQPAAAGETVSKEEYEELKKKLEAAESVLKIVHGEMDNQS